MKSEAHQLGDIIADAKHVMFVTGAGISTASGLPTYRGVGGLYNGSSIVPVEVKMSGSVFNIAPFITWNHLKKIFKASSRAKHNIAHTAIANLERWVPRVTVLTQNVDGFHKDAGSTDVIEIHGSARSLVCTKCDWKDENPDFKNIKSLVPKCPVCNAVVRPPVVLFGENLPDKEVERFYQTFEDFPDVIVGVGTTGSFAYVLEPFMLAKEAGAKTALIDPNPEKGLSNLSDIVIEGGAEDALPLVSRRVAWRKGTVLAPEVML